MPNTEPTEPTELSAAAAAEPGVAQIAGHGPLDTVRVVDLSTVLAGPLAAQILGDFGAEVIKVEHPTHGDPFRGHGAHKHGEGLWWKIISRNKRCIALDLSDADAADIVLSLASTADVLIENFRPGTLERWGLGPDKLLQVNPRLIIARVTGFGQTGPYRSRPGFGTLAEAMSGFAAITGQPDGPPTLPAMGLADSIAGITVVSAVAMALFNRDRPGGSNRGQVIDVSLLEPIMCAVGPGPTVYDQLGIVQQRTGNRSTANAPRNTYLTADGAWLAISTSTTSIARRVLTLVGHADIAAEAWFASAAGRVEHADLLDSLVAEWISARSQAEVVAAFEAADAAVAPIYSASDLVNDPHVQAADMIISVDDPTLGAMKMNNVLFRMSDTPGSIRHTGRALGADTNAVLHELGIDPALVATLRERGSLA